MFQHNSAKIMLIIILVPVILSLTLYADFLWPTFMTSRNSTSKDDMMCWRPIWNNSHNICRKVCADGHFSLPGMTECLPWLNCEDLHKDIEEFKDISSIDHSMKKITLATWKGHTVVINKPVQYEKDFQHGLKMRKLLHGHPNVVQLLGFCDNVMISEYHVLRSADNFPKVERNFSDISAQSRFQMCISYTQIIGHLHNHPAAIFVMCDSNWLEKLLSQCLLRDDLTLLLNDVDALEIIDRDIKNKITCGNIEITGDFVAPEQIYPFAEDAEYIHKNMKPYDEKTDIWKIPDVCNHFIGQGADAIKLRLSVLDVHTKCKEEEPTLRPSASDVLREYYSIMETLFVPTAA